jgi:hypothetical protein
VLQLEPYHVYLEQREQPQFQATGLPERHLRALELLGLDEDEEAPETQDLSTEVDRYFAIPTKGYADSITFWLVSSYLRS